MNKLDDQNEASDTVQWHYYTGAPQELDEYLVHFPKSNAYYIAYMANGAWEDALGSGLGLSEDGTITEGWYASGSYYAQLPAPVKAALVDEEFRNNLIEIRRFLERMGLDLRIMPSEACRQYTLRSPC